MALTTKQRLFVAAYLETWNASEAARRAGYKDPEQAGYENKRKQEIRDAIEAGIQAIMPKGEVLARLADQARSTMGDFLRVDEEEITLSWSLLKMPVDEDGEVDMAGTTIRLAMQENVQPTDRILHTATITRAVARLDLMDASKRGKLHLIKEYKIDKDGATTIKLHDAQAALVWYGKHHGLFVERTEVTGKDGGPIEVDDARERLADKLARRLAPRDPAPGAGGDSGAEPG